METNYDKIKASLLDIEIVLDKLEPTRREHALDLLEKFDNEIKELLNENPND